MARKAAKKSKSWKAKKSTRAAKKMRPAAKKAAKKKVARKTTRKRVDPCQPIRANIARLEKRISDIEDQLSEPDIPPGTRERLEELLRRLKLQLNLAEKRLAECEKKNPPPR